MRITAEAKRETEATIRDVARRLFVRKGLDATSTRDIAKGAKIAVGTLFNYFASKEALALSIVGDAFDAGREEAAARVQAKPLSLDESLFTLIAADLRALEPYRSFLPEVLEAGLSPFARGCSSDTDANPSASIRTARLHDAASILQRHNLGDFATPAVMHLYWSLYLGVVSYWAHDSSPNREDTWALLDQSVRMFTGAMRHADNTSTDRRTSLPTSHNEMNASIAEALSSNTMETRP